jgi:magnesium transporter
MEIRPAELNLSDPITRHMHRTITRLREGQTVGDALQWLRENPPTGRILYLYVVDDDDHLRGVVPTRRLLLSAPDRPVADIMVRQMVALPPDATVLEACEFFIQYRFLALPVVDADRRLLGVVDVELYTEEVSQLDEQVRRDDLFQLIGVHVTAAQADTPLAAVRTRFPWLLCNIGGGLLAAVITGFFEDELQKVVALALFIPVVLALAESVSIQSVSLALQTLHGQPPTWRALLVKLRREALTGVGLGVLCGLAVATVALIWLGHGRVALCLLGGIGGGVAAAATIGLATPHVLRLLQREPSVAAGPIALACADMVSLLLYFGLARALLN